MGSLLKSDGIKFNLSKTKSTDTKSVLGNINKYLYKASLDILKFAPIISADSNIGSIITDWYSLKEQPNIQYKVNIYIKDTVISPEALEVIAFERKKINKKWSLDHQISSINSDLEDKILRKARDLYIKSKK